MERTIIHYGVSQAKSHNAKLSVKANMKQPSTKNSYITRFRARSQTTKDLPPAPPQTNIHVLRQIGWNSRPKLLDILPINLLGEPQRRIQDLAPEGKKPLRNLTRARILTIQARHERRRRTVVVELKMDAALWENGAFECIQDARDGRVLARAHEPIFKHVAESHGASGDDG